MEGPDAEHTEDADERRVAPLDPGVLSGAAQRYWPTLDKTLRSAIVPYGYTVTVWASGAYLISLRGVPDAWEAFAFVAGAIFAFGLLSALAPRGRPGDGNVPPPIHPDSSHPIFAAGLHIAAVGIAFGAATLIDRSLESFAWFFGSFFVTLIYLGIASAELAIAVELSQREIGLRSARGIVRRRGRGGRMRATERRRS